MRSNPFPSQAEKAKVSNWQTINSYRKRIIVDHDRCIFHTGPANLDDYCFSKSKNAKTANISHKTAANL